MSSSSSLEVTNLRKVFDSPEGEFVAIDGLDLRIKPGSFTSIVGPSGCGKSTLLNILVGIEPPTQGKITIGTQGSEQARLGYVFQAPRLLPWLTIQENMEFVHLGRSGPKPNITQELALVNLTGVENKYPRQLSGGMQQRVGIARALSLKPHVLLMDEPFSHLDAITGAKLRQEVLQLWERIGHTVLFVTHDLSEAVMMSDRILLMTYGGKIVSDTQINLPRPRVMTDPDVLRQLAALREQFEAVA